MLRLVLLVLFWLLLFFNVRGCQNEKCIGSGGVPRLHRLASLLVWYTELFRRPFPLKERPATREARSVEGLDGIAFQLLYQSGTMCTLSELLAVNCAYRVGSIFTVAPISLPSHEFCSWHAIPKSKLSLHGGRLWYPPRLLPIQSPQENSSRPTSDTFV